MLYNKVIQLYMYTHPFSFRSLSYMYYHRILGRVLSAIQQVPLAKHSIYLSVHMAVPKNNAFLFSFVCFLGLHSQHVEVPRLGVQSELQLPAYATATATQDPRRHVCNLHHSSQQHQILNPLSHWARAGIEPTTSWFLVGFFSTAQQELQQCISKNCISWSPQTSALSNNGTAFVISYPQTKENFKNGLTESHLGKKKKKKRLELSCEIYDKEAWPRIRIYRKGLDIYFWGLLQGVLDED